MNKEPAKIAAFMDVSLQISTTSRYTRTVAKYVKNDRKRRNEVARALKLFIKNPTHPGLNTELLKNSEFWTMRVNKSDRIFFLWIENKKHALLWDIGVHDKYKRY